MVKSLHKIPVVSWQMEQVCAVLSSKPFHLGMFNFVTCDNQKLKPFIHSTDATLQQLLKPLQTCTALQRD